MPPADTAVLAAIPYTSFPHVSVGPITLQTFGIMVATGILIGSWLAARLGERWGVSRDDTYTLAFRCVLAGVVGARLGWVLSHTSSITSPIDVIAVWDGGLQFSAGFLVALAVAWWSVRDWPALRTWRFLDAAAVGLTAGQAIGRIGCYAVGEHLGGPTTFFLGIRYNGGHTIEGPLEIGTVYHSTSLYEFLHLAVLLVILIRLVRRAELAPGLLMGVFLVWYGVARFLTDTLRAYDHRSLGLTGAQWTSFVLVPLGVWVLLGIRSRAARLLTTVEEADESGAPTAPEAGDGEAVEVTEIATPSTDQDEAGHDDVPDADVGADGGTEPPTPSQA